MAEHLLMAVIPNQPFGKIEITQGSVALAQLDPKDTASFTRAAIVEGRFSGPKVEWHLRTFGAAKSGILVPDEEHRARDATLGTLLAIELVDSVVIIEESLADRFERLSKGAGIEITIRRLP